MGIIYNLNISDNDPDNDSANDSIVIIAGSRSFEPEKTKFYDINIERLDRLINKVVGLSGFDITQVVSGGAKGIDKAGERYAIRNNIQFKYKVFKPKWYVNGVYNPRAGFERNHEMAMYGGKLIAVWDGESGGTVDMIDRMRLIGKEVFVHVPEYCYEKGNINE